MTCFKKSILKATAVQFKSLQSFRTELQQTSLRFRVHHKTQKKRSTLLPWWNPVGFQIIIQCMKPLGMLEIEIVYKNITYIWLLTVLMKKKG